MTTVKRMVELMAEYVQTLDAVQKVEMYDTIRGHAEYELAGFEYWLDTKFGETGKIT